MADEKKRGRGQPPKLTPKELKQKGEAYKAYIDDTGKPPTFAGLAYYTGVDRQTLYNYSQKDEYFGTIKALRDWILASYEEIAITKGHSGIIFLMKNYGYTDKQETEISGNVDIKIGGSVKDWAK